MILSGPAENMITWQSEKYYHSPIHIRVELLPSFKFTGKTIKNLKFTDNYR
jgi:hypothetical protein